METLNKNQSEVKNTISVMNSLGGINSRSDEVENQIINLDDKVEENTQSE